jgi:hypothetical protein
MKQLIEDLISMMEYHVEQTRPIHTTTVALQAAREALESLSAQPAPVQEPWKYRRWNDEAEKWELTDDCGWPSEPLYITPPAAQPAPVQEIDEWMTGCPECGIDSGCDCDSGTWNPPAQPAPVQEPVAWWNGEYGSPVFAFKRDTPGIGLGNPDATPLYTTPPAAQRQWVGLTDEERESIVKEYQSRLATALIIEAKLKEKNT